MLQTIFSSTWLHSEEDLTKFVKHLIFTNEWEG
jgi:hypothetical protein